MLEKLFSMVVFVADGKNRNIQPANIENEFKVVS